MVSSAALEWSPPHTAPAAPASTVRWAAPSSSARRWSLRRTHVVVSLVAAVTALWLGFTAPSVSPVTPGVPAVAAAVGTAADTTGDPAGVTAAVPTTALPTAAPPAVVTRPGRNHGGR